MNKKTKKILILVVCINILIIFVGMPLYKKHIVVSKYEELLQRSAERMVDYYYEYEETEEVYNLEHLVQELHFYHIILSNLEQEADLEKTSTFIAMARSTLQERMEEAEGMEWLIQGLEFLEQNIYDDGGCFTEFVNDNYQ